MEYYRRNSSDTLEEVNSSASGLTSAEVDNRLAKEGYNELKGKAKDPLWKLFLENFKDPMVIVLLIAATVQIVMGHIMESVIIFVVLILNAVISVVQTRKAESSLDALRKMSAPEAKVMRDGALLSIPARELVRGDIVFLEAGDYVPADGRIIESGSLRIDEGMLTGESEAVDKHTDPILQEAPLGDRRNMAFSGSLVVYGRGTLVITGTALGTELGKIAGLIESAEAKQTPLQRKLESFGKNWGSPSCCCRC